jgi:signal transduction histidine kinase
MAKAGRDRPRPPDRASPSIRSRRCSRTWWQRREFVAPGVSPAVAVTVERSDHECCISVTDNGIGIEPKHRERIFGMFKRLHGRDVYPGTGIGLTLVKKIVERHGGKVGVEDSPTGTGTRFWFTLPLSQETKA